MVDGIELLKGVALKRSLEEHAPCASGPEPKKMAGSQPNVLSPTDYTEEWSVPDKMVGLIIGRDGKQIAKLQQESQCRVQVSSDSNGTPDRQCVLTGTKQNVTRAKEMIAALISRGQEASHNKAGAMNGANPNEISIEVPCPANKAGLIIGRQGETIRGLQARAGVKMVLLQDQQGPTSMAEKPIRITGEPHKVEMAKRLVLDLINNSQQNGGGPGGPGRMFGSPMDRGFPHLGQTGPTPVPGEPGAVQEHLVVPQQAVGVVIGKQGDMIKRIQLETGARVQFQSPPDDSLPERICVVTGQSPQVLLACNQISDLISSVLRRDDETTNVLGGMGRGAVRGGRGGRGGFRGGRGGGRGGHMGVGGPLGGLPSPTGGQDEPQIQMQVPANKCGLVIGKQGETIRSLMNVSGAYIELSRAGGPNAAEKFFTIRGSPQAIETAQQLIQEKIGSSGLMSSSNGTPSGYQPNYGGQFAQSAAGSQYGGVAPPASQNAWGQPGPYQQNANGTAQWGQPPTAATPNGDLSKTDPSAWGAFYQYAYTQQPGGQQPTPGAPTPTGSNSNAVSAPPSNGPAGQTDYSQAWIDYYRQLGMYQEADYIEHQFRAGAAAAASPAAQQQGGAPGGPSAVVQNGAPWGSPYATPGGAYGGAPSGPTPYSTYGYPSA